MNIEQTQVAIVGGGFAGSLTAALLEQANIPYMLIDPRPEYPDEFRCEKFNREQIAMLETTGISSKIFEELTPVKDVWMARFGRLVRKQHYPHYGFSYNTAVNAVRNKCINPDAFRQETVTDIETAADSRIVQLSDGSGISAQMVVMANGGNPVLQESLGFERTLLSRRHCLAIGFDVAPDNDFAFDTMTYWPEAASGKMSYLTFFRAGEGWRANLFGYWDMRDPEIVKLRQSADDCLRELMPNLERIVGGFSVTGKLRVRPIDLYQWHPGNVNGIVCIGDAWSSSCPGAGTGTTKAISDALRLGKQFIPEWMKNGTFDAGTIQEFYADGEKCAVDNASLEEAYKLRSITLSSSPYWKAQRFMRFAYHGLRGKLAAG